MRTLFIDIDTLRPDHMGCYGYQRNTTPNMDKVSAEGITFENYYTSDAPCLPSRASLISGLFGIRNGAVGHGSTAADRRLTGAKRGFRDPIDEWCLHNIFRRAGMHTASISSFPERHSSWWFNAGLNECHNVGGQGGEVGNVVYDVATDWLARNGTKDDWYLHVHLWDPHTPYRAPEEFGNLYENEQMPAWITEEVLAKHIKHVGPHSANETAMYDDDMGDFWRQPGKITNMKELHDLFDGYDMGIYYADYLIGKLLDQMRELGIYDDTMIIITSDHGENMGELGIYSEHGTADNITCKIPMIVKGPKIASGVRDSGLHYSLDLLPTLAEYYDVEASDNWDGQTYLTSLTEGADTGRDSLVISQMAHVCQRSARFDDWLYMRTYHDGYHLFEKEMLFNVTEDPHEQFNLADSQEALCAKGAKIILEWHDEQMMKDPTNKDPMWTVLSEGGPEHTKYPLEKYIARLEATGRSEGAKQLRDKYL